MLSSTEGEDDDDDNVILLACWKLVIVRSDLQPSGSDRCEGRFESQIWLPSFPVCKTDQKLCCMGLYVHSDKGVENPFEFHSHRK